MNDLGVVMEKDKATSSDFDFFFVTVDHLHHSVERELAAHFVNQPHVVVPGVEVDFVEVLREELKDRFGRVHIVLEVDPPIEIGSLVTGDLVCVDEVSVDDDRPNVVLDRDLDKISKPQRGMHGAVGIGPHDDFFVVEGNDFVEVARPPSGGGFDFGHDFFEVHGPMIYVGGLGISLDRQLANL